jgi:hypothetical protein
MTKNANLNMRIYRMDGRDYNPLLELRKRNFLSKTGKKFGVARGLSSFAAVMFSGGIRSPKSFFLHELMLSSADSAGFRPASLF